MDNKTESFELLWKSFLTLLRGKLIVASKSRELSVSAANQILMESAGMWRSDYDAAGRWLINLEKSNPQVGKLVRDIVYTDMKFTQIDVKQSNSRIVDYAVTAGAGAVGYGICLWADSSKLVTVLSVIGLGALGYVVSTSVHKVKSQQKDNQIIDEYMNQLAKFHDGIVSILNNE